MASRSIQIVQNLQKSRMETKRLSSRRILGEIPSNIQHEKNVIAKISQEKKHRLSKTTEIPMEVESVDVPELGLPAGVKDIDADDSPSPLLCSEYAKETFVYLKKLELRGAVKPDFLIGCPTSDKMRAVLVDWLVEVQIQFKLVQETLFMTVDTIDR